ncbi:hypothetical protein CfE428DRAFT_4377 [Chthoniobacter flavus Ellin428]|uniref:Glycosyltransferase RgtA/B/C/D-like domain-containing protein n=2 Tax=Chthoniobacter flavus TaxID=191863 RepID=B4D638_9BACT|nr:hypothetical protein CfE428DRAFT_4377 [Chthoniobacter flavus Ellin428]
MRHNSLLVKTALRLGWIILCLVLTLGVRCWNIREVFVEGHIYFLDPDCYSRMTRAKMIVEHPGTIVRHHDFENWPQGVTAHTTAPFDYLIVSLKWTLDGLFKVFGNAQKPSVLRAQTLDLAGALVSPLLGVAGALFLAWWLARFRVRFGGAALLFYALSPILVHGTVLGRPDHQSLLMLTLTVALGAELALARKAESPDAESLASERRWGLVSGIAWGMSLWVSLYEPIIMLVVTGALWLALDRRAFLSRPRVPGAVAGLAIVVFSILLEGWPVAMPDAAIRQYFGNWEGQIGELSRLSFVQLFPWVGWWCLASVVLLWLARREDRRALPMLVMLVVITALSMWQARWGYFLGIVFAWTLPWQMQALRRGWAAWLFFVVGWWPVMDAWDKSLFPDDLMQDQRNMKRAELVALRGLASNVMSQNGGPFLASWWLSPEIAYWSGQPGVAGSSHESLSGIVDTARFFLSGDAATAAEILRRRRVFWVVSDDSSRDVEMSAELLKEKPPEKPLAVTLWDHPEDAPDFLVEWSGRVAVRPDGLRFYRLYEVDNATLPK